MYIKNKVNSVLANLVITDHAARRAKQRLGIGKEALIRTLEKSQDTSFENLTEGIIYNYLQSLKYNLEVKTSKVVLYKDVIYILKLNISTTFDKYNYKLITCYQVPNIIKRYVNQINARDKGYYV